MEKLLVVFAIALSIYGTAFLAKNTGPSKAGIIKMACKYNAKCIRGTK